jgi:hypothetical protein
MRRKLTETANYGAVPTSDDAAIPADVENFFDKYSRGMKIVVEGAQADKHQLDEMQQDQAAYKDLEPPVPQKTHPSPFPRLGLRYRKASYSLAASPLRTEARCPRCSRTTDPEESPEIRVGSRR